MNADKKYVAVVDAYSAGNLLAPEFKSRGYAVVHVQSTKKIWDLLAPTFHPEDFELNLAHEGDLGATVAKLKELNLACIVPGTETGVELADALSEALGLATNGTRRSEARRDKYLMIETARAHGLKVARQVKSASTDRILEWVKEQRLHKVVVKPIKSAGTDSVAVCSGADEIRTAVEAIVGKVNKLGLPNDEVLVQEFLSGTEFFINTVSCRGEHRFTEIWKYKKRSINGREFVYDRNDLMPYHGDIQEELRSYVLGVLAALDIKHGPAHTEVMLTKEGPMLVETGARLDGLSVPSVNKECVGYGPLDLTVDAYLDPEGFFRKTEKPYTLKKHSLTVYLTSEREGVVRGIPGEPKIRRLQSFFQMRLRVKEKSPVKKTIDYFTAPGFVTLVHPDLRTVRSDYEQIRLIEARNGLLDFE